MTKLDRIKQIIDHWRAGDASAIQAIIFIMRIVEEEDNEL